MTTSASVALETWHVPHVRDRRSTDWGGLPRRLRQAGGEKLRGFDSPNAARLPRKANHSRREGGKALQLPEAGDSFLND